MIQVRQLIVVGGPSCAGKTFLLEKIRRLSTLYAKRRRYAEGRHLAALYRSWFERLDEPGLQNHWILRTDRRPLPEAVPYSPETAGLQERTGCRPQRI